MRDSEAAWRAALYGPSGFFTLGERPVDHFRTAPLVGPELAEALLVLLERVDAALGRPARLDFVDVGAGGGELSGAIRRLAPSRLADRLVVTAVDVGPPRAVPGVEWTADLPRSVTGLLVGHEWLDAIPCPLVSWPCADPWVRRWWPLRPGWSAEVGRPRDEAWADAVARVRGAALAVDYGHLLADRAAGRYASGTFAAYRAGRQIEPVFDGSCDLTAHVALDACAEAAGEPYMLVSQRDALEALGVGASAPAGAGMAWLDSAARAGRVAELRAIPGLGAFGWLLHAREIPMPLPPLPAWVP
ncbi:SAM-dependent methyltransferase [Saccharothrix violaceirubra]|uniref:SAM-dependent MidA family methyltransferase n=1 Tax=Saccharothrix violaceirubra TaxID=413306 RepID=A0A7W7T956_9PSEU|nr:SAM-dependent methyltransferase [Saccharothrix violaceirubra]MBB4968878.1 SAM-dependent MidA family methyltransferase [Saccharothrix violaceirubra]